MCHTIQILSFCEHEYGNLVPLVAMFELIWISLDRAGGGEGVGNGDISVTSCELH